ncbi:MAG TPA: hypothetical protein VNF06_03785 [Candidatus Aquilonibacter sp.]|nr:hypothetical protein [Candidatus Aquilonibacter sp.]
MASDLLWELQNRLRYLFFWLEVRKDVPKNWFKGNYSPIKLARFSMVLLALLNFSAVALGSPNWNAATVYSLWLGFASAIYIIVAIIYMLGFRMWYGLSSGFLVLSAIVNYMFDSAGGPDALSATGVTFNNLIALSWLYLVLMGLILMRYDKGSKLNSVLQES